MWLAMLMLGGGPFDRAIYQSLYAGHRPVLASIARILTLLGDPAVLVGGGFAIAVWLWWTGRTRTAGAILLIVLVGRALATAQKYWIARVRPDLEPHLVVVQTSSFPSGHATSSMIVYLTLAMVLVSGVRRRYAAAGAIMLSLLIGLSRVMLGVHWPSDVVGGWAFGLLWVLVTLRPAERLFGSNARTPPKQP